MYNNLTWPAGFSWWRLQDCYWGSFSNICWSFGRGQRDISISSFSLPSCCIIHHWTGYSCRWGLHSV